MGLEDAPRCTYIKVTGHRCGSPALRGEHFCFFHTRMIKGVRYRVDMKASPSAMLEDPESVQVAIMDLITQLLERQIRWREASLVIRALEAAQRNVRLVRFGQKMEEMVSELPDWDKQFFEEHPEYAGDDGPADGKADSAAQSGS